jgi:AcrR family transcriptional regulator
MATSNGPSERSSTRERILDAAMDLFAEQGFKGATISEVERRVGLAAGTGSLYKHFPSKEALLEAAVRWEVDRCRAAMHAAHFAIPRTGDSDQLRLKLYEQTLHDLRRFDRLFRLMLTEGDRVPALREAIWAAVQRPIPRDPTDEQAVDSVAGAALGGYHLFSMMQGRPYNGVREEQFLRVLVGITKTRAPEEPPESRRTTMTVQTNPRRGKSHRTTNGPRKSQDKTENERNPRDT